MQRQDIAAWQHSHDFSTPAEQSAERRTRWVVYLTLAAMVVELAAGWLTGSMALLADGWHMGSHAVALGLSVFAYRFARRHARDPRFSFGTGKVSPLAGYSSALLLAVGALWLLLESGHRLLNPVQIHYGEAIVVAVLGLLVNLASAWLLGGAHDHHHRGHRHGPMDDHRRAGISPAVGHHHHQDHNLRAAYFHVIADALTSLLAIIALTAGLVFGWGFLDPLMGIAGGLLIARWAWGLARDSALTLLDAEDQDATAAAIRQILEAEDDVQVCDLHLWRVGAASHACILSLVTHKPQPVTHYKSLIADIPGIDHLTVEVQQCHDETCLPSDAKCNANDSRYC
ncbi:MAG: CDF family Co(II)/Ni(II) efflux transporter DmeF [Thiohalocapsa sp.]|jgi:cation diffusion facilitator family transporter